MVDVHGEVASEAPNAKSSERKMAENTGRTKTRGPEFLTTDFTDGTDAEPINGHRKLMRHVMNNPIYRR